MPGGSSGGSGSTGYPVDDCAQLEFKARELTAALEAAPQANATAAGKAADLFYGSYRPAIQGAKVTDAVVSGNNAVGEASSTSPSRPPATSRAVTPTPSRPRTSRRRCSTTSNPG
jgi:hypothetical protein